MLSFGRAIEEERIKEGDRVTVLTLGRYDEGGRSRVKSQSSTN
jgi:hypothetical protein